MPRSRPWQQLAGTGRLEVSLGRLAPPVIAAAKANVFDTLACAAAGSSAPAGVEARALAALCGGAPQADLGRIVVPHSPLVFEGTPRRPLEPSLALGAANHAVFGAWLGHSREELAELKARGVIS